MFKEKLKINTNGITLIALVITVIIIIILATVAISFAFGNNGLINRVENARDMYTNDTEYTQGSIANVDAYISSIIGEEGGKTGAIELVALVFVMIMWDL